jgi:hypothetical protein
MFPRMRPATHKEVATIAIEGLRELEDLARCALTDLEGILPEFEPDGDRSHPGWTSAKALRNYFGPEEEEETD